MSSTTARSARLSRDTLAVALATLAAVAVAGTGFWRSFTALADLAVQYGVPASQAWTLPIAVDGLVVVATVAAAARRSARWYAWSLLVAGSIASVVGNGIHAWILTGSPIGVGIAVLPPLVTLAAVHLAILLARQQRDDETDVDNKRPEIITTSPDEEPAEPEPRPVTRLHVAPPIDDELRAKAILLVDDGLSLRAAGEKLGVSKDRVHRWVREHRTAQAAAAAVG